MQKELTIKIDEQVYEGLYKLVGKDAISQFIENLVRPHVTESDLDAEYKEMAADQANESAALEWSEAFIGDVSSTTEKMSAVVSSPIPHSAASPAR